MTSLLLWLEVLLTPFPGAALPTCLYLLSSTRLQAPQRRSCFLYILLCFSLQSELILICRTLDFCVSLGLAHRKYSCTWLVQGGIFAALNKSEQLCNGLLPQGKRQESAGRGFLCPSKRGSLILRQKARVRLAGHKASAARSRARFVSGAMPGHGLLPATHSCFCGSRGAAAPGKPDLISKRGGKGATRPSQIWNRSETGASGSSSSSLSSLLPGLGS